MTTASCTCGPGPLGGQGWRADCPSHNIRELLKAPPGFDPGTVAEKIRQYEENAAMTAPQPETYARGLGEKIRAYRLRIGMTQQEMADRLGRDRRDYQRIEKGKDHCPPGLLSEIRELAMRFEEDIDKVIDGVLDQEESRVEILVSPADDQESAWQRLVAGAAAVIIELDEEVDIDISLTLVGELTERSA